MEIMDVTLRESVYYGNGLCNEDALDYLTRLKTNVSSKYLQYVEIGYLNNDKRCPLNYDEDYFAKALDICEGFFKVSAMMHVPKADMMGWNADIVRRLHLVRVVVGQHVPDELAGYVSYFHSLGVKVSVNLTYIAGMSDEKIIAEIHRAEKIGIDFIFGADSSGSCSPLMTKHVCQLLLENCGSMITGVHLHDHMQMALANTLTAKRMGIQMTDVSVTGAGKGGGNLKMEQGLLLVYGTDSVTDTLVQGLYEMVVYFAALIGRNPDYYSHKMCDFMTGLYRLSMKETDSLEKTFDNDRKAYLKEVVEKYKPCEVI